MMQGHPSSQGMPGGVQQPGVSMGQQMHAGVVGPGGPQVTQAGPMMAGMMPGGGPPGVSGVPSAHAQAHLTPGHQGPMYQQQQQMQHLSKSIRNFSISFNFSTVKGTPEISSASFLLACRSPNSPPNDICGDAL